MAKAPQQLTNANLIKFFYSKYKSQLISGMKWSKENVQIPALSSRIGADFLLVYTRTYAHI